MVQWYEKSDEERKVMRDKGLCVYCGEPLSKSVDCQGYHGDLAMANADVVVTPIHGSGMRELAQGPEQFNAWLKKCSLVKCPKCGCEFTPQ